MLKAIKPKEEGVRSPTNGRAAKLLADYRLAYDQGRLPQWLKNVYIKPAALKELPAAAAAVEAVSASMSVPPNTPVTTPIAAPRLKPTEPKDHPLMEPMPDFELPKSAIHMDPLDFAMATQRKKVECNFLPMWQFKGGHGIKEPTHPCNTPVRRGPLYQREVHIDKPVLGRFRITD